MFYLKEDNTDNTFRVADMNVIFNVAFVVWALWLSSKYNINAKYSFVPYYVAEEWNCFANRRLQVFILKIIYDLWKLQRFEQTPFLGVYLFSWIYYIKYVAFRNVRIKKQLIFEIMEIILEPTLMKWHWFY